MKTRFDGATKGPLRIEHEFNVFDEQGRLIANCGGHSRNSQVEKVYVENCANAELVQHAPSLLEELIKCRDLLVRGAPVTRESTTEWLHDSETRLAAIDKLLGVEE